MEITAADRYGRDDAMGAAAGAGKSAFDSLIRRIRVLPPTGNSLPAEPVFDAATDLNPGITGARPKRFMLGGCFGYATSELEHCASKVGVATPVKLLSATGVEKFRQLLRLFRAQGLVESEKNPDRDAARGCTFHSRFLHDFISDPILLAYFSSVAGIALVPIPVRYSQVQINMLPAYDPDVVEPGFGAHIDSTNFACILDITKDRSMEGGALQHALMTRDQFLERSGSRNNVAHAFLHMILPDSELLTTRFAEAGSAVFHQGSLVPHQVENVRKVDGIRETVAFTLHPANPMLRRLDFFSIASTWDSRGIRADIGNLLVELADLRIEAINGALDLVESGAGARALRPEQPDELQAGLENSTALKQAAQQFLVDLSNGVGGASCPDDTFVTPSVFDVGYRP